MTEARIIEDLAALDDLAPAWWDLWSHCPSATPFQSPAWLLAWRRHFAPGPLRCAAGFVEGRLAALFPFYLETAEYGRRLLPLGISLSDYLDVLLEPESPGMAAALVRLMGGLAWEEWRFAQLAPDALAHRLACPENCSETFDEEEACPVLPLRGGENLEACVPARRRRQWRRALASAERRGRVEIDAEASSDEFLDILFALHGARWRTRGEKGVLDDPQVQSFHRAALPGLRGGGLARTFVLRIDGQPVAAYYGFHHAHRAFAYIGGFDPAFEEASPSALLVGHAVQTALREGASEYHFLRGRESYKYTWGAQDRWSRSRVWRRRHD
jgi:CelD/BcsL family acetyltransferase involved in cellulose biosynthesis